MINLFSVSEIADLTGAELTAVRHWANKKLLPAVRGGDGRGRDRLYGFPAVVVAGIFNELVRSGVQVNQLGPLSEELFKGADLGGWAADAPLYFGYMQALGQAQNRLLGLDGPPTYIVLAAVDGDDGRTYNIGIVGHNDLETATFRDKPLAEYRFHMWVNLTAILAGIIPRSGIAF